MIFCLFICKNIHNIIIIQNEGHSDVVTDLCFNTQSANELFSCSKDKQIIQWDISNFTQLRLY